MADQGNDSSNIINQGGSLETIEKIVENYYQALYRFAYSLTKSQHEAADLTQQTFLIYSTKGHTIKDATKIKSWLFTTLYREFLGQKRKSSRLEGFDSLTVEVEDLNHLSRPLVKEEDVGNLLKALDTLDPIYKRVIVLYYLKDLSYKEVADILNIPIGTVMSRLSRGKKQLKISMQHENFTNINSLGNELTSSSKEYTQSVKKRKSP